MSKTIAALVVIGLGLLAADSAVSKMQSLVAERVALLDLVCLADR